MTSQYPLVPLLFVTLLSGAAAVSAAESASSPSAFFGLPPPSASVCSVSSMFSQSSFQTSFFGSYFTDPLTQLKAIRNTIINLLTYQAQQDMLPLQNIITDYNELAPYPLTPLYANYNPGKWDNSPLRSSEWMNGPLASTRSFNYSCMYEYLNANNGVQWTDDYTCTYNETDKLSELCPQQHPDCPSFQNALRTPIDYVTWHQINIGKYCPIYCLNPARYNNSYASFIFQFSLPLASIYPYYHDLYRGHVYAWYFIGLRDAMRYLPSLQNSTAGSAGAIFGWDTIFPALQSLGYSPTGDALYTTPYFDAVSTNTMITINLPVYDHNEHIGSVFTDIIVQNNAQKLASIPSTSSSFALIAIASSGQIVAASQSAYNAIFCPSFCVNSTTGLFYDYNARILANPLGLADSLNGYSSLLPYFSNFSYTSSIIPPLLTRSLNTGTSLNVSFYVTWQHISLPPLDLVYAFFAPTIEIDSAAQWLCSPQNLLVVQPNIDDYTDTPIMNANGLWYTSKNRYTTVMLAVVNSGILNLTASVQSPTPFISVSLIPSSSSTFSSLFTQSTSSQLPASQSASFAGRSPSSFFLLGAYSRGSVLSSATLSRLASGPSSLTQDDIQTLYNRDSKEQSVITIQVTIDWAVADGSSLIELVLQPQTDENEQGCFSDNVVPIRFEYGTMYQTAEVDKTVQIGVYVLLVLVSLYIISTSVAVFMKRDEPLIKASAPFFTQISLFGSLCSSLCSILFVLQADQSASLCTWRVWALPLSLMTMLASVFVKTFRVGEIFNQKVLRHKKMSDRLLFGLLAVLYIPLFIILVVHELLPLSSNSGFHSFERVDVTAALTVTPTYPDQLNMMTTKTGTYFNTFGQRDNQCTMSISFVASTLSYFGVIMMFGVAQAFRVRKVVAAFNETSQILTGLSFAVIYAVLLLPIDFLLTSTSTSSSSSVILLRSLGLLFGVFFFTLSMTLPKLAPELLASSSASDSSNKYGVNGTAHKKRSQKHNHSTNSGKSKVTRANPNGVDRHSQLQLVLSTPSSPTATSHKITTAAAGTPAATTAAGVGVGDRPSIVDDQDETRLHGDHIHHHLRHPSFNYSVDSTNQNQRALIQTTAASPASSPSSSSSSLHQSSSTSSTASSSPVMELSKVKTSSSLAPSSSSPIQNIQNIQNIPPLLLTNLMISYSAWRASSSSSSVASSPSPSSSPSPPPEARPSTIVTVHGYDSRTNPDVNANVSVNVNANHNQLNSDRASDDENSDHDHDANANGHAANTEEYLAPNSPSLHLRVLPSLAPASLASSGHAHGHGHSSTMPLTLSRLLRDVEALARSIEAKKKPAKAMI